MSMMNNRCHTHSNCMHFSYIIMLQSCECPAKQKDLSYFVHTFFSLTLYTNINSTESYFLCNEEYFSLTFASAFLVKCPAKEKHYPKNSNLCTQNWMTA